MSVTRLAALLVLLLVTGCAKTEATSAPVAYSGPSWFDQNGVLHGFTSSTAPVNEGSPARYQPFINPVPPVQVAPPMEGGPVTRAPYAYQPGSSPPSGSYGTPLDPGPVTGYGAGGLVKAPGAPSNPPFHF
jgi:hypothetical protein